MKKLLCRLFRHDMEPQSEVIFGAIYFGLVCKRCQHTVITEVYNPIPRVDFTTRGLVFFEPHEQRLH
jgi:hypothetical protein